MNVAELKAELKDLAALLPKDGSENQLRAVEFHVKQVRTYIERIVNKTENRLAKQAMRDAEELKARTAKDKARRARKKNEAEVELAKVDPPVEGQVTVKT